ADAQRGNVGQMSLRFQSGDFFKEDFRIYDDAVADHAEFVGVEGTGGNEGKDCFFAVDDQRMARIVTTLKAHHDIRIVGKEIYDLALTFVSPLSADDCDVGHFPILDFRFWIRNLKSKIANRLQLHQLRRYDLR